MKRMFSLHDISIQTLELDVIAIFTKRFCQQLERKFSKQTFGIQQQR